VGYNYSGTPFPFRALKAPEGMVEKNTGRAEEAYETPPRANNSRSFLFGVRCSSEVPLGIIISTPREPYKIGMPTRFCTLLSLLRDLLL